MKLPEPVRAFQTREDAVEFGRLLGEAAADENYEIGPERELRIKRAMMYAAWEYDGGRTGKGQPPENYREEFDLTGHKVELAKKTGGRDWLLTEKRK